MSQDRNAQNGCKVRIPAGQCSICDSVKSIEPKSGAKRDVDCDDLLLVIKSLLDLHQMQKQVLPRVVMMRNLRRLLSHTNNASHLDLKNSTFGQWCLRALHSSLRDLRVAAGSVMSHVMKIWQALTTTLAER